MSLNPLTFMQFVIQQYHSVRWSISRSWLSWLSSISSESACCVRQNAYYLRRFSFLRVLIVDAGSFQALAAILDYLTHLGSISCWHQSDVIQQELRLSQDAYIYCEFQKYEAMTMSVICGQPKKHTHTNTSYKATKHIVCIFLISDNDRPSVITTINMAIQSLK